MNFFISRFIYGNGASKRHTSIILGHDLTGPGGQSKLLRLITGREFNTRPADLEAGMLTPRPKLTDYMNTIYTCQIGNFIF